MVWWDGLGTYEIALNAMPVGSVSVDFDLRLCKSCIFWIWVILVLNCKVMNRLNQKYMTKQTPHGFIISIFYYVATAHH